LVMRIPKCWNDRSILQDYPLPLLFLVLSEGTSKRGEVALTPALLQEVLDVENGVRTFPSGSLYL
jgi:hypothetical protein